MKNITIAYTLSFLWRSWFWLGIWIFYYLRFTDYAGIGFLETLMMATATIGEIPTGAIADMVGKRKAVILSFVLGAMGNVIMALAQNYPMLVLSIVTMTLGSAFYSGSLEALVYDSLKENNEENRYQKVVGRMNSMQNAGMAVAGIVGGLLYQIHVSLPFLMVGVTYMIGIIVAWRLSEPNIDTEKYSWSKFLAQNKQGFNQLFANRQTTYMIMLFIVPSAFMVGTENLLNDASAIELGYSSLEFGVYASAMFLFGVFVSEKSDWIINKVGAKYIYNALLIGYLLSLLLIPKLAIVAGTAMLLFRYGVQTIYDNYQSARINAVIESRYRATSLSTFSLLRNIPYLLGATGIGVMMNIYTARTFSMYFGIAFAVVMIVLFLAKPLALYKSNK